MSKRKGRSVPDPPRKPRSSIKSMVVRQCSLITYVSEYTIQNALERWKDYIMEWAYIRHDRDFYLEDDEDHKKGDHKETHYHIVLKLWQCVRSQTIVNWFADPWTGQNTLFKPIETSLGSAYAYLDHRNAPEKFQYPAQCIKASNLAFWESLDDFVAVDTDPLTQSVFDLIDGVPYIDVVRQYGRDFILASGHVDNVVRHISCEQHFRVQYLELQDGINKLQDQIDDLIEQKKYLEVQCKSLLLQSELAPMIKEKN